MSAVKPSECQTCSALLDEIQSCPNCDDQSYTDPCSWCKKSVRKLQSSDFECNTCQKYICDDCWDSGEVCPNPGDGYCPLCIQDPSNPTLDDD